MSIKKLSPMGEILKQEWENGWKTRCEKEIKNATFQKAFHYSAKEHIKFGGTHPDFRQLVADFIDLGSYKKFAKRIQLILEIKCESVEEFEEKVILALSNTVLKVEEILGDNEIKETTIKEITKSDIIELWNNKGLWEKVYYESVHTGFKKALLKVFKEYFDIHSPGCALTSNIYTGMPGSVTSFFKRLSVILGIEGKTSAEIIDVLYDGRTENIPNFFSYKTPGIKIHQKIKS